MTTNERKRAWHHPGPIRPLRLAIVGCGAVTDRMHLPAIRNAGLFELTVLVDADRARAKRLADLWRVPHVIDEYRRLPEEIDAAIVALPNALHAPVACHLLRRGIHVLVEKPMALRLEDADEMIEAAQMHARTLAIGLCLRFLEPYRWVKHALEAGWLGKIERFDIQRGSTTAWPSATQARFQPGMSGGGVLADHGVHLLDLLLWWLGPVACVTYFDDALGGVESDCRIELQMEDGAEGVVELSHTRALRNTCRFEGEHGMLEVEASGYQPRIRLSLHRERSVLTCKAHTDARPSSMQSVFVRQLTDFAEAIVEGRAPLVPGHEGRRSVQLIEACYANRRPLIHPWTLPAQLALEVTAS